MTITHQIVADRTGTTIPPHLIAQAEVPTAANGWRQGDVMVMPHVAVPKGTGIDISVGAGHKVVAGEADRNSHILNGDGMFHPGRYRSDFDYGLLVVPAGGVAVLTHTAEHGSVAFPGGKSGRTYRVWGQVSHEQELRRAVD